MKTGKQETVKRYLFKIGGKLFSVKQEYLNAFNDGKNTFFINETKLLSPMFVMNGDEIAGLIMPTQPPKNVDYDAFESVADVLERDNKAKEEKKAALEQQPVNHIKDFNKVLHY